MSFFVHAQGIKTVHAGGGGAKKCQSSVHVVVECPLMKKSESVGAGTITKKLRCMRRCMQNNFCGADVGAPH